MATDIDLMDLSSLGLSEWQQEQLRIQAANLRNIKAINHNNAPASYVPRSMSTNNMPVAKYLPTADPMDRTHSAPAAASTAMGRSTSSLPLSGDNSFGAGNMSQRSLSSLSAWSQDDETSGYIYSQPSHLQKRRSLQPINEMPTFDANGVVEYEPAEWVNNCSSSSSLPYTPNINRLSIGQLTPDMQWTCPPLDGSISPSAASVEAMTPAMSRQVSCNPQFYDQVSMLRVQSDSSSYYAPMLSQEHDFSSSFPAASDVDQSTVVNSSCVDTSLSFFPSSRCFNGSLSNEAVFPSSHIASSANALEASQQQHSQQHTQQSTHQQQLSLGAGMMRSASTSSTESETGSPSSSASSQSSSRQSRRASEINAHASRPLAPKKLAVSNNEHNTRSTSAVHADPSFNIQMKSVMSADGSSKQVAPIAKAPYIRPTHPKIMCPHCNARPEGFRGTHELERHVARAHAPTRKGYICIDASEDKKFLASCKHCRKQKVYGAYYNAAAHLRRAHFHPRKRGRKGKHDEKRGGIGGGDDPPMDVLKAKWIREIEVDDDGLQQKQKQIKRVQQPVAVAPAVFPPSVNNAAPIEIDMDSSNEEEAFAVNYPAYPPPIVTDMSNMPMLDFNNQQYIDQNGFVHSAVSDGSVFDPSLQYYNNGSAVEEFNFEASQFDAY